MIGASGRILAAVFALALLACGPRAAPAPPAMAAEPAPALWRLGDADSEIWIFGTVHMLPQGVSWQSRRIMAAFEAADTVYFEADTDAALVARLTNELGRNPPGVRLTDGLSADDRARFARICAELGLPPAAFETARPWLAAIQLSVAHVVARGHQAALGVEAVLVARMLPSGRTPRYLETAESQIRALADLSSAEQYAYLAASLREIEAEPDLPDRMAKAWAVGDQAALDAMVSDMNAEAGSAVYQALIMRRNAAWADQIETMLEGKGVIFIAAGAAHFAGPDSVVTLLRQRGLAVEGP